MMICMQPKFRASDNPSAIIPPEILVTSARPNVKSTIVILIELTTPLNHLQMPMQGSLPSRITW